ncbi:endonuclease/exonuclease/phosphatase family protein [Planctomicrobium sp. SH527]|uniref:endonuclease/exonuclease/phosphatase family protein n=1 Tax=Planctomicrobium sp. SH527 TaxID=3448123 RepID=UPI003F5B46C5
MEEKKSSAGLLMVLVNGLCLFTVLGFLLRVTIRDFWHVPGVFFYMTPLPILAVAGAVCFLAYSTSKLHRRTFLCAAILVITIPWLLAQDFRWQGAEPVVTSSDQPLRVLFWNVARRDDLTATLNEIRSANADVVGLVELTGATEDRRALLRETLPEYGVSVLGSNMYLLAKGESGESVPRELGGNSAARTLEVRVRGELWRILLVDIDSDLKRSRSRDLQMLAEFCTDYADQNLIVMGDFNTPIDSLHYAGLRQSHRELYEVAGSGYSPTWPVPLPVLRIDQMWFNSRVTPVGYRKITTSLSDHSALEGAFLVNRDAGPAAEPSR